ncbi:hypothetical protein [Pseudoalteromonas denitrificans]|uniref:Uncharacterized protein n=1 Tax=Pseudoalteromonas denitrificans DSM 6059 TaxID=1123010 RepID=A0A1I1IGF4_9GAMM|nr:hypothetical protein [Pseudoalteromonas denitrificans]SFC32843.1 hypothetical protein SAMN02745724_01442 [Pseudoalteromonas denitrificans DSM 6059]
MHYRLNITSRALAAIFGGYAFAVASSFALVPILMLFFSLVKSDAVYLATMLSYIFYFAAIIFSFCRSSILLVCRDMTLACGVLYLVHLGASTL